MDTMEHQARTVAVKSCASCGAALLERDKFCRRCGVVQLDQVSGGVAPLADTARCFALANGSGSGVYHRVSGLLVNAVTSGALAGSPANDLSPAMKRAILALIWIPIWLIIVLLSPLDAYSAVKSLARQT